ncbi:cytochrome P450 [Ceratobasidium sp. AG-I]|nr:cytochrome P450 [Ceratobasidium sp. AG-I]
MASISLAKAASKSSVNASGFSDAGSDVVTDTPTAGAADVLVVGGTADGAGFPFMHILWTVQKLIYDLCICLCYFFYTLNAIGAFNATGICWNSAAACPVPFSSGTISPTLTSSPAMLDEAEDTLLIQFTGDEAVIKDYIVSILVAGRNMTAATLTFAVYLLATNPDVMHKLRQEIFDHENFREMEYPRAAINETLRRAPPAFPFRAVVWLASSLFPALPVNERTAVKSTVFRLGGKEFYVPAGAKCVYALLMGYGRICGGAFVRSECLGQQFAYNESSFFLTRLQRVESINLVLEADLEGTLPPKAWKDGSGWKVYEKTWLKSHLTIYSHGGL